jgi:hypothetical protein
MSRDDAKNSHSNAFVTAVLTWNLAGFGREIQLINERVTNLAFGDAVEIPVESRTNCACHFVDETCARMRQVRRWDVSTLFSIGYNGSTLQEVTFYQLPDLHSFGAVACGSGYFTQTSKQYSIY